MNKQDEDFGFAPDHDAPLPYRQRIREYYQALGYGKPYQWAHYAEVPFTPLKKPLKDCRVAVITTSAPYKEGAGDQGPGAPYNNAAKFFKVYSGSSSTDPDLRISHIGIDRKHTTAEDINSWLPLAALRAAAKAGRIKEVAPRFHGAPTNRSHDTTINVDSQELLARLKEDRADAVLIAGN
jgi:D-proline reductase (dithiol) PrdB